MVTYSDDKKFAYIDGLRFCRDERTGYYLNAVTHKRLHRYIYERVHGAIPKGYQVHHIDHDKGNNEPDNLRLLTKSEHMRLHGKEMTEEQRQWKRDNLLSKAVPASVAWRHTEEAREMYKRRYEAMKHLLHVRTEMTCKECGKQFEGLKNNHNVFCSNACKSAWRRKSGVDNENRKCVICGAAFAVNKYAKTVCCSKSCSSRLAYMNRAVGG